MEYDIYYYLTHPTYSTYENMLRDENYWDNSIKEKYNQQQSSVKEEKNGHQRTIKEENELITKEEYEPKVNEDQPTSSKPSQSIQRSFVIQLDSLDVCLRLVDCLENEPITKEEYEPKVNEDQPTSSKPSQSIQRSFAVQLDSLDLCLRLVDCLDNRLSTITTLSSTTSPPPPTIATTTTTRKYSVLTPGSTSENDINPTVKGSQASKKTCNICNKEFRVSELKIHMTSHTGVKPHVCSHCGDSFSRRNYLRTHLRTHTGERPYSCEVCDYTCTQKSNLTKHM